MTAKKAIMCDVFATVMDPNPSSPRLDGIWGQVEFPTLQRSGNEGCVTSIVGTSPDGQDVQDIWSRPGMSCELATPLPSTMPEVTPLPEKRDVRLRMVRGIIPDVPVVEARQEDPDSCGAESDDVAAEFDEGGAFEVDW
ncbi:hypothetical protein V8F06_009847 [Rhypophila decipiens]